MAEGYVSIYRKIFDNPIYFSEKFDRTHAWIDLILITNHRPATFWVRGNKVEISRGEVGHSLENLSTRWRWSIGKVKRFLDWLADEKQITYKTSNVTTIISILNYDSYQIITGQIDGQTGGQTERRQTGRRVDKRNVNGTQTDGQTETNNNDNNDNKLKEKEKEKESPSDSDTSNKPLPAISVPEIASSPKTLHENLIERHSRFYVEKVGSKYLFNGGADGRAAKEIIAHLKKSAKDKGTPDDDDHIMLGWEFILENFDKWDAFYKPQLKLIQIKNNLVNILANIRGINGKPEKPNHNNAMRQFLAGAAQADKSGKRNG